MKTPEEYIKEARENWAKKEGYESFRQMMEDHNIKNIPTTEKLTLAALKSMQEDADKEMIDLVSHASYQVALSQLSNEEEYHQGKIDAYLDMIDKIPAIQK